MGAIQAIPNLFPYRTQIPNIEPDDVSTRSFFIKLNAIAAGRRINAIREHALAIVGEHLNAGTVDEDVQFHARTLLDLG